MPPMRPQGVVIDPIKFVKQLWPEIYLYDKQREILYSVNENDETFVPAGNMLGKDFIASIAVLYFFMSRNPCRIVTTSVDNTQLNAVLWGEIRARLQSSRIPLLSEDGGPLLFNNLHIRKYVKDKLCGVSYIIGRVASDTGEGMLGHHIANIGDGIPRTLFVADEASGVPHVYYDKADTWAERKLVIGNPYECQNFFKYSVKGTPGTLDCGGDLPRKSGRGFYRKVIKIKAEDSPNVKLGLLQEQKGVEPTNEILVPGVKSYDVYKKNRLLWDKIKQSISLDAEFYEGAELLLFPPLWLDKSHEYAIQLVDKYLGKRKAVSMGVDTAAGNDTSSWCVIDKFGLLDLYSVQTPDTSEVMSITERMMVKWKLSAHEVLFDAGGGGKEHADYLRKIKGLPVKAIGFGEAASKENPYRKMLNRHERSDQKEIKVAYKNKRAEMYDMFRQLLNPTTGKGFAIPHEYSELRRQLAPIPLLYDGEGKMYLPPKRKPNPDSEEITLKEIIGRSPDDADALVLAVYNMLNDIGQSVAGAII